MALNMMTSNAFTAEMALRGFHVYRNTENWAPIIGEELTFMPEHHNSHDRFAVAGQSFLPGRLAPVTVGHVQRELSRYIWHAIEGCHL